MKHHLSSDDEEYDFKQRNMYKKDEIKFIRAKYGRSCAVTNLGRVYFWG